MQEEFEERCAKVFFERPALRTTTTQAKEPALEVRELGSLCITK